MIDPTNLPLPWREALVWAFIVAACLGLHAAGLYVAASYSSDALLRRLPAAFCVEVRP